MATTIYKNYVGGAWMECATRKTFDNVDPAHTDKVIATFQDSQEVDVLRAVEYAHDAFKMWKNTPAPKRGEILFKAADNNDSFITVSQGIFETNIVTSKNLRPFVEEIFEQETLTNSMLDLASITIKLPKENLEQSGIYYFILKQLAWADIPLQEIISTTNEMTIVVKEKDINQTFAILMDMKLN